MAVDSLRDTFHKNWVEPDEIGLLLSAQSYRADITKAVKDIKTSVNWLSLQEICNNKIGPGPHPKYGDSGHPCLKTKHVMGLLISKSNFDWVPVYLAKPMKRFFVQDGNILLNITGAGSIGRVSIYYGNEQPLTNQHIARLDIKKDYDSAYICAFLSSWWGERIIEQGISGSTGQLNLVNDHIHTLPILIPDPKAQDYIGDKVRQAERLRDRSKALENKFQNILSEDYPDVFGAVKFKGKSSSAELDDLTDNLNPGAYEPERLRIRRYLREHGGKRIQDISLIETAITSEYSGSDVYIGLDAISSISSMISPSTIGAEEIRSSARVLSEGPVISKLRPYLNKVTYIPSEFTGALGSTELFCVKSKNNVSSWFIYGVLKLDSTIRQLNPVSTGSTHPRVSREDILDLMIPWSDEHQLLGQQLEMAQKGYFISENLTVAAKLLVEALIEGKISEADLKAAQEGLEKSDITLDREILDRLTRKGIDRPNEPPLFPDLDALYAALASLDKTETNEEADHGKSRVSKVYHLHGTPLALASEAPETSYAKPKEVPE
jgi:type I restriction enzyme, S subunit